MSAGHDSIAADRRRHNRVVPGPLVTSIGMVLCLLLVPYQAVVGQKAGTREKQPVPQINQRELDEEALEEFKKEVDEYVAKRRKLEKRLTPIPKDATPTSVHEYGVALEKLIVAARARAEEGDLFVSEVKPMIRRLCREVLTGPAATALLSEIREEAAERVRVRPRINTRYPDDVPLSAVPYQLLKVLPPLPIELEYRVVGSDLLLLDADARVIVDVLRRAIPR